MAMTKAQLRKVRQLTKEVAKLASDVIDEIDDQTQWDHEQKRMVPTYPDGAPNNTRLYTGSHTTGELRRRSMDLTRALAELRRH